MTMVMVLAAGHGTRLRPLTDRLPKALIPLGDRPMLAHVIDGLHSRLGEFELSVNAHHMAGRVAEFVRQHHPRGNVFVEPTLLGTAGGVRAAWRAFRGEPVLVVNADILAVPDYTRLLQVAHDADCCLCLSQRETGGGSVGVSAAGHVVRLRGEVFGPEASGGDYMGIAVLGAQAGASLPESGCLVGDWMLPRLRRGEVIRAHFDGTDWQDIGEPRSYANANWKWLAARGQRSWVSASAAVSSSATLSDVIVGAGASIEAAGAFERVIVWPGATLTEVVNDCVVMGDGAIVSLGD